MVLIISNKFLNMIYVSFTTYSSKKERCRNITRIYSVMFSNFAVKQEKLYGVILFLFFHIIVEFLLRGVILCVIYQKQTINVWFLQIAMLESVNWACVQTIIITFCLYSMPKYHVTRSITPGLEWHSMRMRKVAELFQTN